MKKITKILFGLAILSVFLPIVVLFLLSGELVHRLGGWSSAVYWFSSGFGGVILAGLVLGLSLFIVGLVLQTGKRKLIQIVFWFFGISFVIFVVLFIHPPTSICHPVFFGDIGGPGPDCDLSRGVAKDIIASSIIALLLLAVSLRIDRQQKERLIKN